MCGVVGVLAIDAPRPQRHEIEAMTSAIAHRGPDGEGVFIDGSLGLGHRRLAIIDVSESGAQPMLSADKRFAISYNGELYNYRELRRELQSLGHRFATESDTEVVLCALIEWRERALIKFNGMFAFAFWDCQERSLLLARDRFGVKPLYICWSGGVFCFASEIKAMLAHPGIAPSLDLEGLMEYMTFQNFFTERTLFDGVHALPAASYVRIGPTSRRRPEPIQYWDYEFAEPDHFRSEDEYCEELDSLFRQAVSRQLVSDVEVGAYLSGGMDSGAVTALAAQRYPYLKSFTCGFDLSSASGVELNYDERPAAEAMSAAFMTEHYEMVLKAGDMERCIDQLVFHLEEPRVGQSYPNFYASKLASRFVKVVLTGTGGDELFGGYPWRYYRSVSAESFEGFVDDYYAFWQRLIPNKVLQAVFSPVWGSVQNVWTRDIMRNMFGQRAARLTRPEDYVKHSMYFEAKTFLSGLLTVEDKLSMAHSLESRVPFLDNDLVNFAMRLPVSMKLRDLQEVVRVNENAPGAKSAQYYQRTNDGKILLRRMMRNHVPEAVVEREKQGFSAPDASWFKGESIEFVKRMLYSGNPLLFDILDRKPLLALVDEHLEGRVNRRLLIWSLLYLESFLRQYFPTGASAAVLPERVRSW